MTETQATQPVPENEVEKAASTTEDQPPEGEAELPPEPWTPERVNEWNAYYDLYVMAATLLLAFVVSCNSLTDSAVFTHLKAGQLINERSRPLMTDAFSYTEQGQPWVDVPWLFQWSHSTLYNLVYGLVPVDPVDPTANRARAEQIAIGTLVILDALVRLATAWMLLKIRRRGPGLWWSAICVTAALGVVFHPLFGIVMGGVANIPEVGPSTWGQLFLAIEVFFLFNAFGQGRTRSLWPLIPLFLIWVNWDISFLTGLLVLAAAVTGRWLDGDHARWLVSNASGSSAPPGNENAVETDVAETRPPSVQSGFVVLGLCAAACLVNPWTYRAYVEAAKPFVQLFHTTEGFQLLALRSFFGVGLRGDDGYLLPVFFLLLVVLGIGSFWLNLARFSWSRFLPFAAISILWGIMMRYSAEFAVVFAAVMALNGQEWYQARFGREGRLGRMWTLWSTGGRLVTLSLIFAAVGKDITGWHNTLGGNRFGVSYDADDFPFEAAEFLEQQNELKGNILNTSSPQGDILIWKAYPKRKTYVDSRSGLFPLSVFEQLDKVRKAIMNDDIATWKPMLDEHNITAVMIEPYGMQASPKTYETLMRSNNWIPFYDDGRVVMFGRSDAPASDLSVFKANQLDPDRVYRVVRRDMPTSASPPGQTSWIDEIFQNRTYQRPQMRNLSAQRWLERGAVPNQVLLPEPAQCLIAIQEARIALSRSPDDWTAFHRLNEAYRYLMVQETAMLGGLAIIPENKDQISRISPNPERLMNRFRQRVTSLNFAIQTTPPPDSPPARRGLFELNMQLFQLYMSVGFRDLARDRLQTGLELSQSDDYVAADMRGQLEDQLNQLNQAIKQVEDRLEDLAIENQATPVDQAMFARQQGAVGLAITKLAEAERSGVSPMIVKPQLVDLYCTTGQPDKALDLLSVGSVEDPNLGTEPGTAAYRQGLVYLLLGNYLSTSSLWQDRSIRRVRDDRSLRLLMAGQGLVRGQALQSTNTFLSLPSSLGKQATWEFDLAMCQLEGGMPDAAAEHFTKALTLEPDLSVRPIAAYYLQKIGKPVPPKRSDSKPGKPGEPVGTSPALTTPIPGPATPTNPGVPAPKPADSQPKAAPAEPAKTPASPQEKPAEPAKEKATGKEGSPKASS
jgi:tetratricopeptide (TPR) repeat protein